MSELYKVSGGGNDFLALVEPEREPTAAEIVAWCARGLALGADGVFVLRRSAAGARMDYWNSDGRPADLCINGTRCAARLALDRGWGEDRVVIETGAGPMAARRAGATSIALELPPPGNLPRATRVDLGSGRSVDGWFVSVGVPHFVVPWKGGLAGAPVAELGAALRRHAIFAPAGTNVDFVAYPSSQRMEVRSFERGVEAETLACGTGVLASVAVGLQLNLAQLPVSVLTLGGFELVVDGQTVDSVPARWTLAGDARVLARVELLPDAAAAAPPPPRWTA